MLQKESDNTESSNHVPPNNFSSSNIVSKNIRHETVHPAEYSDPKSINIYTLVIKQEEERTESRKRRTQKNRTIAKTTICT